MKGKRSSLRIVFLGTPEFAVCSLDAIHQSHHEVVGVVTALDKPAGRGKKLKSSAVKEYAVEHNLTLLQPPNLKRESFLDELRSLSADLFVVVAFRMLPVLVWDMPSLGTINLHGSLLPQYRGAAPIHWAVINGEKQTGVTTFQLQHKIDTGNILQQQAFDIKETDTTGDVHDKMMVIGAECLLKTIDMICEGDIKGTQQDHLDPDELKHAPKLSKEIAKVDWNQDATSVYNHIRGMNPFPTAWSTLRQGENEITFKIWASQKGTTSSLNPGELKSSDSGWAVGCANRSSIVITELQMAGKKRMKVQDFERGFALASDARFS